jgi:hypothetical protein
MVLPKAVPGFKAKPGTIVAAVDAAPPAVEVPVDAPPMLDGPRGAGFPAVVAGLAPPV